ncbi:hypothetical protein AB433_09225 [Croceicoccus naphthovorans]|uniref:Structural protein MipA n=1 Tax=Croceicoccus naphthovorans TaxID=1348774 RepID=A0A0G3XKF9_9SPHN|nr:hypothetical protein AB433_09225 [Croceicoccus naphthovorans]
MGFATKGIGLELDLIPNLPGDIELSLGPEFRYRQTRTGDLKDDVVDLLPKLDKTFEVGIDAGISFKKLFTPMDSLAFGASKRWDVSGNGAGSNHNVSVSYSTALSKGMGAGVSLGASWYDDDYADYYYTITPEGSAATGGQLPTYNAKSGMKDWDARIFYGLDLDGDFRNGGLALAAALSYQRLQGSAAETPIVSMRGDRNQYAALLGVGYAF